MKIDWLRLENFKNLTNFEVDFSLETERQVVIGRNGVGKSNILESIAWIFRDLDLGEESDFEYTIKYRCRGHYVKVVSKGKSTRKPKRKGIRRENTQRFKRTYWVIESAADINGKSGEEVEELFVEVKEAEFNRRNQAIKDDNGVYQFPDTRVLPDYVFGYYSGISARFNEAFEDHERDYYQDQKNGDEMSLRTMFLAKPHHSQFSLLSFFAKSDENTEKFLLEEFDIESLSSVLFTLQEPYWSSSIKKNELEKQNKDRRFWGAGGNVEPFLQKLFDLAYAPMAGTERKEISINRTTNLETRYCFLNSQDCIQKLAEGLEPKEFFTRLESAIFSDVLSLDGSGLKIRVKLQGVQDAITFKEMSEGEQQLLTIIGLMRFTQQNESLFLLDEPDTHLNPAWCLDLLKNLKDHGVDPKRSQILITTHNPLTFAGLDKHEVVIVDKDSDGSIYSYHPTSAPKGMGFQSILTSDFFKLRSTLDRDTLVLLDEKRYLANKEIKSSDEEKRLLELDTMLGRLDFSKSARDPLYLEYIRAMSAAQEVYPEIADASPSEEEWVKRKSIALDIAKRLKNVEAD